MAQVGAWPQPVTVEQFLRDGGPADNFAAFEHYHAETRVRQVPGCGQSVVTTTDHDDVCVMCHGLGIVQQFEGKVSVSSEVYERPRSSIPVTSFRESTLTSRDVYASRISRRARMRSVSGLSDRRSPALLQCEKRHVHVPFGQFA